MIEERKKERRKEGRKEEKERKKERKEREINFPSRILNNSCRYSALN